jgi:hypothetical protein
VLAENLASGRTRDVHGDIAASDDNHLLADGELVSEINVQQELDATVDAIQVDPGNAEVAASMRTDRDEDGVESLTAKFPDVEVATGGRVKSQLDVPCLEDLSHLRFDNATWKAVFGDAKVEHAACNGGRVEQGYCVPHERQIVGRRESNWAGADDCYLIGELLDVFRSYIERVPRFGSVTFGEESLKTSNGNRLVDLAAAASRFAGVRADPPAYAGERIRFASEPIGLFEPPLCNQANIPSGISMRRAGHHARKIRVQPTLVDFLVAKSIDHSNFRLYAVLG